MFLWERLAAGAHHPHGFEGERWGGGRAAAPPCRPEPADDLGRYCLTIQLSWFHVS